MSPSPGLSDPCARVTSKPSGSSAGDSAAAWIAGPPMFSRVITRTTGTRALAFSGVGTFGLDSMPERLNLGRRRLFAASAITLSLLGAAGAMLAADVYLHRKYERTSLVNVWGYRGRPRGAKQPG